MPRFCRYCSALIPDDANPKRKYCSQWCAMTSANKGRFVEAPVLSRPISAETLAKFAAWREDVKRRREEGKRIPPQMERCSSCLELFPVCQIDQMLCVRCTIQRDARAQERKQKTLTPVITCWCGRVQCQRHREESETK